MMMDQGQMELINDQAKATLREWRTQHGQELIYFVGVDIGGTNARVALQNGLSKDTFVQITKFKASSSSHLKQGFETLSAEIAALLGVNATGACLAGAGRISDDGTVLDVTNYVGGDEERHLRSKDLPPNLFPPKNTRFINDLESTCFGITALNDAHSLQNYFKPLWTPAGGDTISMRPIHYLVLAVGTGLGVATIISLKRGPTNYQVMPMEFGHTSISPVGTGQQEKHKEETELIEQLSKQIYGSSHTLEYEDIVSGRGLMATYNCLASRVPEAPKCMEPDEIAQNAFKEPPCPLATEALLLHYRFLMRLAKNLCVGLQAKGIFLAGDNQVENNPFFEKHLPLLREEFLEHPKRSWIEGVELYTQIKSFNINLQGAMFVARS